MPRKLISFVIPCYKSAQSLPQVVAGIGQQMAGRAGWRHEVILVDDASPDDTYEVIKRLAAEDGTITGLRLARNFGQQSAMMAGLAAAQGEYVVFMDDDGQHPPEGIWPLLEPLLASDDMAIARFTGKKHSLLQRLGSRVNDAMAVLLIDKPRQLRFSSFFAIKAFVARGVLAFTSPNPYILGYCLQITKSIVNVDLPHHARLAGESNYTFGKMLRLWLSGFTSFSVKPLRLASSAGVVLALAGFVFAVVTVIRKLVQPNLLVGYASTMAALMFIGGAIIALLGMLGEYIGQMFQTVNRLPQYVLREDTRESEQDLGRH